MAEKMQCKVCGYMLDPNTQFCPMCFEPIGTTNITGTTMAPIFKEPPLPKKKNLVGLIIALSVEVLMVVGVVMATGYFKEKEDVTYALQEKDYNMRQQKKSLQSSTPQQTTTQNTQQTVVNVWSPEFEDFVEAAAPGNNKNMDYNIDMYTLADYTSDIQFVPFTYSGTGSLANDFGGVYPSNLFCHASERENISESLGYGDINYQANWVGNDGTILRYEYIRGWSDTKNENTALNIIASEESNYDMYIDRSQYKIRDDKTVNLIITGEIKYPYASDYYAITELFKIDGNQIYKMTFSYPGSDNDYDLSMRKRYVAECLVRECLFSGEPRDEIRKRSWDDYKNNMGAL